MVTTADAEVLAMLYNGVASNYTINLKVLKEKQ